MSGKLHFESYIFCVLALGSFNSLKHAAVSHSNRRLKPHFQFSIPDMNDYVTCVFTLMSRLRKLRFYYVSFTHVSSTSSTRAFR